jgi:hypothetical protein
VDAADGFHTRASSAFFRPGLPLLAVSAHREFPRLAAAAGLPAALLPASPVPRLRPRRPSAPRCREAHGQPRGRAATPLTASARHCRMPLDPAPAPAAPPVGPDRLAIVEPRAPRVPGQHTALRVLLNISDRSSPDRSTPGRAAAAPLVPSAHERVIRRLRSLPSPTSLPAPRALATARSGRCGYVPINARCVSSPTRPTAE